MAMAATAAKRQTQHRRAECVDHIIELFVATPFALLRRLLGGERSEDEIAGRRGRLDRSLDLGGRLSRLVNSAIFPSWSLFPLQLAVVIGLLQIDSLFGRERVVEGLVKALRGKRP